MCQERLENVLLGLLLFVLLRTLCPQGASQGYPGGQAEGQSA